MESEKTENGLLEHWSPEEVKEAFDRDEIVLIDVRTPQEYSLERIDGSLLSPLQSFLPNHMPGQTDKRIVFHCASGSISSKVAEETLAAGAKRIAHMKGGLSAWKADGFSYTGTDKSTGGPVARQKVENN